jgi:1,4-alpha-glucan branching enzyme
MVILETDARHTFRVYLPEAEGIELVGSFTDWRTRPVRMTREHTGWWSVSLGPTALPPGDHDFSYLVNGTQWLADYAASGVKRNGFGGWVSQIHVAGDDSAAARVRFPARRANVAA